MQNYCLGCQGLLLLSAPKAPNALGKMVFKHAADLTGYTELSCQIINIIEKNIQFDIHYSFKIAFI